MEEVAKHLLMVIQIWGPFRFVSILSVNGLNYIQKIIDTHYRRRSTEWITAEKARTLLENVDGKYLHRWYKQNPY